MATLWDEIQRNKIVPPMEDVVVIDGTEPARYLWSSSQEVWSVDDDCPNVAPPFPAMFVFVRPPRYFQSERGMMPWGEIHPYGRYGVLVEAVDDGGSNLSRMLSKSPGGVHAKSRVTSILPGAKWSVKATLWIESRDILPALIEYFSVGHDGSAASLYVSVPEGSASITRRLHPNVSEQEIVDDYRLSFGILITSCLLSISFMHCKNVTRTRVDPPAALSKKHLKKHGRPLVSYYTLDINQMKQVLRTEGGMANGNSLQKALHICRGHFATYTREKPLFGRHTGTFWVPQHVRGNADNGINVKDYRVVAGGATS